MLGSILKKYEHSDLSEQVIAAAYDVHNELGQGFLEKVYKNAMAIELKNRGIQRSPEVPLKVGYKGEIVGEYDADLVIDGKIIVEVKAVGSLNDSREVQLVNYLKATGIRLGLLINFGKSVEVKRRVFG